MKLSFSDITDTMISPYEIVRFHCSENFGVVFVAPTVKLRNLAMFSFAQFLFPHKTL